MFRVVCHRAGPQRIGCRPKSSAGRRRSYLGRVKAGVALAGHQPHVIHPELPVAGTVDADAQGRRGPVVGEGEGKGNCLPLRAQFRGLSEGRCAAASAATAPTGCGGCDRRLPPGGIGTHSGAQHVARAGVRRNGPREQSDLRRLLSQVGTAFSARKGAQAEAAAGRACRIRTPQQVGITLAGQPPTQQPQLEVAVRDKIAAWRSRFLLARRRNRLEGAGDIGDPQARQSCRPPRCPADSSRSRRDGAPLSPGSAGRSSGP